jgi:uncharacterized protein (DUF2235 family)
MPKNIIFCADGTWNGPGQPDSDNKAAATTNVFKLFINIDGSDSVDTAMLAKEQERALNDADGTVLQCAKYLHGVGDSDNFLVKALGGTVGAGLIERIVRGYTFVSRNYVAGDRIFIIGFSRGAYTARALAGLIAAKGLIDATKNDLTKEDAYRLGSAVWYAYRKSAVQANSAWFGRLEEIAFDLPHFMSRPPGDDQLIDAPIEAVAVWDTVGALGIPLFTVKAARIDAFQFADRRLNAKVARGLHAISVDERRADFTPTLWDADPRVTQVLFPGAHADVGGGYPPEVNQSSLSDCALVWMTAELQALGVRFSAAPAYVAAPNPAAFSHEPWMKLPWPALPQSARLFPDGLCLSKCLIGRLGQVAAMPGASVPYNPGNLARYLNGSNAAEGVTVV